MNVFGGMWEEDRVGPCAATKEATSECVQRNVGGGQSRSVAVSHTGPPGSCTLIIRLNKLQNFCRCRADSSKCAEGDTDSLIT